MWITISVLVVLAVVAFFLERKLVERRRKRNLDAAVKEALAARRPEPASDPIPEMYRGPSSFVRGGELPSVGSGNRGIPKERDPYYGLPPSLSMSSQPQRQVSLQDDGISVTDLLLLNAMFNSGSSAPPVPNSLGSPIPQTYSPDPVPTPSYSDDSSTRSTRDYTPPPSQNDDAVNYNATSDSTFTPDNVYDSGSSSSYDSSPSSYDSGSSSFGSD